MPTGTVKWYNPTKRFGFIKPDPDFGANDIFVHVSAVEKAGLMIDEGMRLSFDLEDRNGKVSAINLKLIG
jgi:cold shock protein